MKIRSSLFVSYVSLLIVYAFFTLLPHPSKLILLHYHISALRLRLLDITIIIILAAIWYIGFYGYDKLSTYSKLITADKDGEQVSKLTKGVFFLVLWLPVSSVISAILKYITTKHEGLSPAVSIIDNYISLILPLIGFGFISAGTRGLSELVRQRPTYKAINILAVILVYIGLIDYHLIAATPHRAAVYHMNIWLIMTTIVAPYICMWFLGMLATYEIYRYRLKIKGIVYKNSWHLLSLGIGWLIIVSIAFQYLTTVTSRLDRLSIYWIVLILYSLLLVLSVGFVLIAAGSRKLQKIEEV